MAGVRRAEFIEEGVCRDSAKEKGRFRGVDLMLRHAGSYAPAVRTFDVQLTADCKYGDSWSAETWKKIQPWVDCAVRDADRAKRNRFQPPPQNDKFAVKSNVWWKVVLECADDLIGRRMTEGRGLTFGSSPAVTF